MHTAGEGLEAIYGSSSVTYSVKHIFLSIQGEGAQVGRVATFCRFTGCNLWSGREKDRSTAICKFCDTDFLGNDEPGGGKYKTAAALAMAIADCWIPNSGPRLVVITGGEPLLQLDEPLITELHKLNFEVAIETNGTLPVPDGIDWVCVSPKAGSQLVVKRGDELKVVYPQTGLDMDHLESLPFSYRFVQPMDGPNTAINTKAGLDYCLSHPKWRLSIQTHKQIGIE